MKTLLKLVLVCCLINPAFACINRKGTKLDGDETHMSFSPVYSLRDSLKTDLTKEGARLEEKLRGESGPTNRNDYAVALIYLGRLDEAISLLQELEAEEPGDYATAANLGTAYELAGKNELALKWIGEGIRRNPDAHQGTEWIHVKILEAKIQQQQNPDYFKTHSVLNLDLRKITEDPKFLTVGDKTRSAHDLKQDMLYQLQERLKFVKQKDPSVASLLFDFGVLEAATATVETARPLMSMAVDFGYPTDQVEPFYRKFDHAIMVARTRKITFYSMIGLAIVAFLAYSVKRRWIAKV